MKSINIRHSQKVYVTGVNIGNRVRCYSLISLREISPPYTMFRVFYSSLDRWRVTFTRVFLRLALVSVSHRPERRAVSHKPFQSPHWKCLALEMICLTLSRRVVHGESNVGRNWATESKMCGGKESRGYLSCSARSGTRCILTVNWSTVSTFCITAAMWKSWRSNRWSCLLWIDKVVWWKT